MAKFSIEFYLFGCPHCGLVISQDTKRPPICCDFRCSRFGEPLVSWHELMDRVDGDGWKYGG